MAKSKKGKNKAGQQKGPKSLARDAQSAAPKSKNKKKGKGK